MPRLLRPLVHAVTYTRWLHMLLASVVAFVCGIIFPGLSDTSPARWALIVTLPIPLVVAAAMVPVMRRAEGLQARLMLFPGSHARERDDTSDPGISASPSASWREVARTAVWMVLRLEVGCAVALGCGQLMASTLALIGAAIGEPLNDDGILLWTPAAPWLSALLIPVPLAVMMVFVTLTGAGMAGAARRLLGSSPAERLAALEERTERVLERNRIARELHDSIGHALTVAVVQAGAARAAGDAAFTERALDAIEETGRAALEELERVLIVLRDAERPVSARPTLADADRLLDSARASGAKLDVEVSGPLERVPGPVSREGYRMLQESLTNVLRHAGSVPVRVRVTVLHARVEIDVRNPLTVEAARNLSPKEPSRPSGRGSGLRGIRERAALLGGRAHTGPDDGEWRVYVELPLT
ncbi:histidine kinase [Streptomyces sp. NPDC058001]|uniref:histidine kinase n=1 Tax=Streptomyces sp. NPDC058001 TaxID=3346300 RepID=UPI0036E42374